MSVSVKQPRYKLQRKNSKLNTFNPSSISTISIESNSWKKCQPRLSFCSETRSIGSSTCSTNCEVPTCNCGEIAVSKVSWTSDNQGRKFYGCPNFVSHTCMLFYFVCQLGDFILPLIVIQIILGKYFESPKLPNKIH